jgi:hypothetical protein
MGAIVATSFPFDAGSSRVLCQSADKTTVITYFGDANVRDICHLQRDN